MKATLTQQEVLASMEVLLLGLKTLLLLFLPLFSCSVLLSLRLLLSRWSRGVFSVIDYVFRVRRRGTEILIRENFLEDRLSLKRNGAENVKVQQNRPGSGDLSRTYYATMVTTGRYVFRRGLQTCPPTRVTIETSRLTSGRVSPVS